MNNVIALAPRIKNTQISSNDHLEQFIHDIKSPLHALKIFLDGAVAKEKIGQVNLCLERIEDMIHKLEEQQGSTQGALQFLEPVKSHPAHAIVSEIVSEKAAELGLNIQLVSTECAETTMIKVQRMEFKRVLSNLMNNAFEACQKNSKIQIDVCAFCIGDQLMLEISDNGVGINDSQLQKVFKRGHSLKGSSGLGLAYAQEKITSWNGDLTLISQLGQGTTVAISLPSYPAS